MKCFANALYPNSRCITLANQVARECGMLPLALGIAGASVKDRPLDAVSWRNKHLELKEKHVKFREMDNGVLFTTIDVSFNNLSKTSQEQFQQLGVMASGVAASPAMLADLWQTVRRSVNVRPQLFPLTLYEAIRPGTPKCISQGTVPPACPLRRVLPRKRTARDSQFDT